MYIRRSGENALPVDHVLAGYDGCPKGEINAMYTKKGLRLDDHWYTIFENKNPQNLLFTAIFTCPFEGEHFASGNWGPVENIVKVGDTYWYSEFHLAFFKSMRMPVTKLIKPPYCDREKEASKDRSCCKSS